MSVCVCLSVVCLRSISKNVILSRVIRSEYESECESLMEMGGEGEGETAWLVLQSKSTSAKGERVSGRGRKKGREGERERKEEGRKGREATVATAEADPLTRLNSPCLSVSLSLSRSRLSADDRRD